MSAPDVSARFRYSRFSVSCIVDGLCGCPSALDACMARRLVHGECSVLVYYDADYGIRVRNHPGKFTERESRREQNEKKSMTRNI